MQLLLDAHVSGRAIARALRERGHDVLALGEHRSLEGLDDPSVLELAASEGRILLTFDVKDFPPLLRGWAEAERPHAGCIVVHGLEHGEFGRVLRGLEHLFAARPAQADWADLVLILSAATANADG